jgi:hypothetical protein
MLQICSKSLLAIALVIAMFSNAHAGTVYSESINGDLSDNGLSPTAITVSVGPNIISGTTGGTIPATPGFRDYFTIVIPFNLQLVSLIEVAGTQAAGNFGFLGVQHAPQVTLATNTATANGLLGWIHYASTAVDLDILPSMGTAGNQAQGFVPPLGNGTYSFWLQDSSPGTFQYSFNLNLAVPEPSSMALMVSGLFGLWPFLRRRLNGRR